MPLMDLLEAVVIGAGASGLSAAKELLTVFPNAKGDQDQQSSSSRRIVVLEESDAVGGMWHKQGEAYRIDIDSSNDGVVGLPCVSVSDINDDGDTSSAAKISVAISNQPLYDNLISNIPKQIMCYRDMPHSHDVPMMPRPQHVQEYFQRYATVHNLLSTIQFQSRVIRCSKVNVDDDGDDDDDDGDDGGSSSYWEIVVLQGQEDGCEKEVMYRSKRLVVCTGHFRKAYVPPRIRGVRHFRGQLLHSSAFRNPQQFGEGSTVLIVGGSISAADIAKILLSKRDVKVLVSVREFRSWPHGILLRKLKKMGLIRPGIRHIDQDGTVHFFDTAAIDDAAKAKGAHQQINNLPVRPDAIIFATGYRYDYPFLPKDGGFIERDGFKMCRLYMRMLYADDPSLVFLQVPTETLSTFMLVEYQSRWYAQYVQGKLNVTEEIMEAEILSRKDDRTADSLRIIAGYVPYCNSLARMTGDYTLWGQVFWIRFPMMIKSFWFAVKQRSSLGLFGSK